MYLMWYLAVLYSVSEEGMQVYADLFKENHITGKRLLLLTESDMRDMGVKSKGHVMHLKAIITVCNPHLMCSRQVYSQSCVLSPVGWNWETDSWLSRPGPFPSPAEGLMFLLFECLFTGVWKITIISIYFPQEELEKQVEMSKTIKLELVFGYHWKPGTGKDVGSVRETSSDGFILKTITNVCDIRFVWRLLWIVSFFAANDGKHHVLVLKQFVEEHHNDGILWPLKASVGMQKKRQINISFSALHHIHLCLLTALC